jgi:aspartate 1-decarboxylase
MRKSKIHRATVTDANLGKGDACEATGTPTFATP